MFFKRIQLGHKPFCKNLTKAVLAAFLFSTAFTTTRVIKAQPDTALLELAKGDIVKITAKEGGNFKLKIVESTSEAITGIELKRRSGVVSQQQILFNEIAKIEETKSDPFGSLSVIALGAGVLVLIFLNELMKSDD